MRVGAVSEVKAGERRVGLTPGGVAELTSRGHTVLIEAGAGFADAAYVNQGAVITDSAAEIWASSELLVKVKQPVAGEHDLLHEQLTLFTYLHLAADPALTDALMASGATAIAYESVRGDDGGLPLLAPMSLIAGRLAGQVAAQFLLASEGGPGLLLGGAPGARPARVLVIGGGVVGTEAARMAVGLHADVTILERSSERLRELDEIFRGRVRTLPSDPHTLAELPPGVDVIIGAVLLPGARAPELVDRSDLARMRAGTLLIDVAIDQGGCFATSRPTTHTEPVFEIDGIRHYCVTNMPGAVPVTATAALTCATLPYVFALADAGVDAASERRPGLADGVSVRDGQLLLESALAVS